MGLAWSATDGIRPRLQRCNFSAGWDEHRIDE